MKKAKVPEKRVTKVFKAYGTEFSVCLPQIRTAKFNLYDIKQGKDVTRLFTLAYPFTVFWVNQYEGSHHVAFAKDQDLKNLYVVPMHNSFENFAICGLGSTTPDKLAEEFWQTTFIVGDSEYVGAYYLTKSTMKNYRSWEKLTKVDPKFILHPNCSYGSQPVPMEKAFSKYYEPEETAPAKKFLNCF